MTHKPPPLWQRYEQYVANHIIDFDAAQWKALQALQTLLDELHADDEKSAQVKFWQRKTVAKTIQGLYLFGDVGRGKSMLMAWFYEACELPKK
ncbi:MAG: AFG1/ZapE family ATPase, partial [Methylococcaceae bacterium]